MSIKNQVLSHFSSSELERLNDEFHNYVGRDTYLNKSEGTLTVFAYPKDSKRAKKAAAKARRKKQAEYNPEWEKYDQ